MTDKMRIFAKGILQGLSCPSAPLGATPNKESAALPVGNQADHGCNARLLIGYLAGRRIAAHRTTQERVPVAYLYKNVRVPYKLTWDKEKYPFAFLYGGYYRESVSLLCATCKVTTNDSGSTQSATETPITYIQASVLNWEGEPYEELVFGEPVNGYGVFAYTLLWANYDIYTKSNKLYLEASEPIPVYE